MYLIRVFSTGTDKGLRLFITIRHISLPSYHIQYRLIIIQNFLIGSQPLYDLRQHALTTLVNQARNDLVSHILGRSPEHFLQLSC